MDFERALSILEGTLEQKRQIIAMLDIHHKEEFLAYIDQRILWRDEHNEATANAVGRLKFGSSPEAPRKKPRSLRERGEIGLAVGTLRQRSAQVKRDLDRQLEGLEDAFEGKLPERKESCPPCTIQLK